MASDQAVLAISDIEKAVCELAAERGICKAILFGSYARGEQTPESDVDILIDKGDLRGLQVIAFERELSQKMGKDVDIVTTGAVGPRLGKRIAQDQVTLYEA